VIELEEWLEGMKQALVKRTGRSDISVTGGPHRGYDVKVWHKDCHPLVDFYSAMRWDPRRINAALNYAVSLIEDWEATLAEREREMAYVRPIFERIQRMFPEYEMHYTTRYGETHFVQAENKESKIIVSFDLWPAMKEKDIQRLIEFIREHVREVSGLTRWGASGADYW